MIPQGEFPELLRLHENIAYVRGVLASQAHWTSRLENYVEEAKLPDNAPFYAFQRQLNTPPEQVPTHFVIQNYMDTHGKDYRWQTAEEPIPALRDRTKDDITVGREKLTSGKAYVQ